MSDEASKCEYSFKYTAYNSAATILVCVRKTDRVISFVSYNCRIMYILLTPLKITTVVYPKETHLGSNNDIYIVRSFKSVA